ncbi:MAG TPA: HTTM domain-containing protein [Acidimicrobiales bacterium]
MRAALATPAALLARADAALDDVVGRRGDVRAIALMRVLFGAIVIRHLWPDVRASVLPVERFHVPWWSWLPVPSPAAYRGLLWLGVAAGVGMILGLAARVATVTAFAVVGYLLFVDMTGFAHNRGFLVWILFGLSLVPTGGAFTVMNLTRRSGGGVPRTGSVQRVWPVLLLQVVVSSVYLTSGLTKLANPDWRSGLVLWDRVVRQRHLIPRLGADVQLLGDRSPPHMDGADDPAGIGDRRVTAVAHAAPAARSPRTGRHRAGFRARTMRK